jgi:hypothetical protein
MKELIEINVSPKEKEISIEYAEDSNDVRTALINYNSVVLENDLSDGTLLLHFDLKSKSFRYLKDSKKCHIPAFFLKWLKEYFPIDTRNHYWYLSFDNKDLAFRTIIHRNDCSNQGDAEKIEGAEVESLNEFANKHKVHGTTYSIPFDWKLSDSQYRFCLERLGEDTEIVKNGIDKGDKGRIIDICIETLTLYFLISLNNRRYFDYVATNLVPRALCSACYKSEYNNDGYDIVSNRFDGNPVKELMPYLRKILKEIKDKTQ